MGFPPQIRYIVGNEACERFSFYGMKSILVIFMTEQLLMTGPEARTAYHLFVSACYLLPLLGGWLSDRYLGKYRTIFYLSIVYCLGHLTLAVWENRTGVYWGLALIALGAGGIKPCVSAHVGDQFNDKNQHLLQRVFNLFYFFINFGSFFSTLLVPVLLVRYGASVAFGVPGVLMAIATVVFRMGKPLYVHVPPARDTGAAGFLPVVGYAIRAKLFGGRRRTNGRPWLDAALERYTAAEVEAARAALDVFKVLIAVSIFWALYDQNGSSWVLQAKQMDLTLFGVKLEPAQIQAANPILVMLLIPFFRYVVYPAVEAMGIRLTSLRKMAAGMVLAAFSFVVVAMAQASLDAGQTVSVAWQLLAYLILTSSEVMVSITGLEFAYTQAPRSMKSTIMSFWLLTFFAGNLLDAYVAKINVFQGAMFFWFFAALMLGISGVFAVAAGRYRVRQFVEEAPA
jgi:POT family proton-dependent oligopeptide transporter